MLSGARIRWFSSDCCVHARWRPCHYCIFMDIARRLGCGVGAVVIGMRGVEKNLVAKSHKKRDKSTVMEWTAVSSGTRPTRCSLRTIDCNVSQASSSREYVAMWLEIRWKIWDDIIFLLGYWFPSIEKRSRQHTEDRCTLLGERVENLNPFRINCCEGQYIGSHRRRLKRYMVRGFMFFIFLVNYCWNLVMVM